MAYTRERHQDRLVSADEGQLYKRALTGPDSRCCYRAVIESRVKHDPLEPASCHIMCAVHPEMYTGAMSGSLTGF